MVIEKFKRDYMISFLSFVLIEFLFILIFAYIALNDKDLFPEGLLVLFLSSIGFWYLTISKIKNRYKLFMSQRFKVTSLSNKLNYPAYFKKSIRFRLFVWDKAYLSKRLIIPHKFIGFVEGKLAYPIKELDEIQLNNHYEILYIHKGYAALITDMNRKNYLIHLNNLEPLE